MAMPRAIGLGIALAGGLAGTTRKIRDLVQMLPAAMTITAGLPPRRKPLWQGFRMVMVEL